MSRPLDPGSWSAAADIASRAAVNELVECDPAYWLRRAEELLNARPRRGEFTGQATIQEITTRYANLTEAAQACRNRATLATGATIELVDQAESLTQELIEALNDEHDQAVERMRQAITRGTKPEFLQHLLGVIDVIDDRRQVAQIRLRFITAQRPAEIAA